LIDESIKTCKIRNIRKLEKNANLFFPFFVRARFSLFSSFRVDYLLRMDFGCCLFVASSCSSRLIVVVLVEDEHDDEHHIDPQSTAFNARD